jgi:hypothetical protein
MALWVKPGCKPERVRPENGKAFTLEELYRYTNGGPIEVVCPVGGPYNRVCVLNEEGKLRQLPTNEWATTFYNNPQDYIVGDVLICNDEEVE